MPHFTNGDTSSKIKAIETRYNGRKFRSRHEARWALFFDECDTTYSYEPEGFNLGALGCYLPDFYLPEKKLWVEVKPFLKPFKRIYLDGKISKHDWRTTIVNGLRDSDAFFEDGTEVSINEYPLLCTGPFFVSCDHGCSHGKNTHGVGFGCGSGSWTELQSSKGYTKFVTKKSLSGIDRSQTVFAWIDDLTCYGTLIECGYAIAHNKDLRVGMSNELKNKIITSSDNQHLGIPNSVGNHDLWFLESVSKQFVFSDSASAAFETLYSNDVFDSINKLKCVAGIKKERYVVVFGEPAYYQECGNTSIFKSIDSVNYNKAINKATEMRFEKGV